MITQEIKERVHEIKDFYRFDVIKEVCTEKIKVPISLCTDSEGNIYLSCKETRNIVVFDAFLNEKSAFLSDITPINLVVTNEYIIISSWRDGKIGLYRLNGEHIWTKPSSEVRSELQAPCVGTFEDGSLWLLDLFTNTIHTMLLSNTGDVELKKQCVVQEKRYYIPETGEWLLRGLVKQIDGQLVAVYKNALYAISQTGELTQIVTLPYQVTNITSLLCFGKKYFVLDSAQNTIIVFTVEGSRLQMHKVLSFDINDGIIMRMVAHDGYVYYMKRTLSGKVTLVKCQL